MKDLKLEVMPIDQLGNWLDFLDTGAEPTGTASICLLSELVSDLTFVGIIAASVGDSVQFTIFSKYTAVTSHGRRVRKSIEESGTSYSKNPWNFDKSINFFPLRSIPNLVSSGNKVGKEKTALKLAIMECTRKCITRIVYIELPHKYKMNKSSLKT